MESAVADFFNEIVVALNAECATLQQDTAWWRLSLEEVWSHIDDICGLYDSGGDRVATH